MAGRTGKAFWFSTDSKDFVTGSPSGTASAKPKTLLSPPESYRLFEQDRRSYEVDCTPTIPTR